jgi:hypothetical protein
MEQEELTSLIEEERTRREEAYAELRSGGPLYTSSAYGRLEFTGNRGFQWEQFGRLVPRIIPSGSSGGGTVRFDHFLDSSLKQEYSGVFSLRFRELSEPLIFMYTLDEGRLKLEHVTEEKIDQRVVQERASYPLIMAFFSQGER